MATGGTTIAITTTNNSAATTKRFNHSPPAPPPRCGNYWMTAPLNLPQQQHNLSSNDSYRSATVSRRAFVIPPDSGENNCSGFQARNMLSSQSASNIFGTISQQQQRHRHLLLAQPQTINQSSNYQRCSSTLMKLVFF